MRITNPTPPPLRPTYQTAIDLLKDAFKYGDNKELFNDKIEVAVKYIQKLKK